MNFPRHIVVMIGFPNSCYFQVSEIDLETLIKLYCNHRPVFGLPLFKVYDAFNTLAGADGEGKIDRGKDRVQCLAILIQVPANLF